MASRFPWHSYKRWDRRSQHIRREGALYYVVVQGVLTGAACFLVFMLNYFTGLGGFPRITPATLTWSLVSDSAVQSAFVGLLVGFVSWFIYAYRYGAPGSRRNND